jgi:hypothetical protein
LLNEVTVPAFLEDIPSVREEVAQYYTNVSRFDVAFGLMMKEVIFGVRSLVGSMNPRIGKTLADRPH